MSLRNRLLDLITEQPEQPQRNRLTDLLDGDWAPRQQQRGPQTALFAGPNAQTADLSELSAAMTMTDAGTPREEVWRQTGWWQNPAGQWRFEINDSAATVNPTGDTLGERLVHPAAYAAYPDLQALPVLNYSTDERTLAQYSPIQDKMYFNDNAKNNDTRAVTLHETQHAIDKREGSITSAAYRWGPFYQRSVNEQDARLVERRMNYPPGTSPPPWSEYDSGGEKNIIHNEATALRFAQAEDRQRTERLNELTDEYDAIQRYRAGQKIPDWQRRMFEKYPVMADESRLREIQWFVDRAADAYGHEIDAMRILQRRK